ncbi:MAG: hypothetical protein ACRD59_04935 [Candidatus Acidiferrales bacterium]
MRSKLLNLFVVFGALLIVATGSPSARAQSNTDEKEKPSIYTYVAQWAVARADWPAMEKPDPAQKQLFEKLMADGTIIGYGSYRVVAHQEGAPNFGNWWTATSMANLMKALEAVSARTGASDLNKILGESKHWDLVLTSRQYGVHAGTVENGYLRVGTFLVKPGQGELFEKGMKNYLVPILDKLLADGALHSYSVDHEAIHSGDPGVVDVAIVTNNADGLDKFMAALEAGGKANPLGGPAFANSTDSASHRDFLAIASETSK